MTARYISGVVLFLKSLLVLSLFVNPSSALASNLSAPAYSDGSVSVIWHCYFNSFCNLQRETSSGAWAHVTRFGRRTRGAYTLNLPVGTHRIRLELWDQGGSSAPIVRSREIVTTTVIGELDSVSNIEVPESSYDGMFKVKWTSVELAGRYELEVKKDNGAWVSEYSGGALEHRVELADGDYLFRVRACLGSVCSLYSSSSLVFVTPEPEADDNTSNSHIPFKATPSLVSDYEITQTNAVGVTAGQFRVNESGAATYSVPIGTVAGTAGVAPEVALSYSSQAGSGPLGKGWSLSGMRAISRCRQTLMQDGESKPLTWTASDRFCLDGQRLLVVSGSYGAPGSVYKTEIDTFVRVTAVGGVVGRPDYFMLESKDGSKSLFGGVGNHESEVVGYSGSGVAQPQRVLSWQLSRFEDSVGNAIVYRYSRSSNFNRISKIEYAFGSSNIPGAYIEFEYDEDRLDPQHRFVAGSRFSSTSRLSSVRSYSDGNLVRRYELDYAAPKNSADITSRLIAIHECDATMCLSPTEFSWGGIARRASFSRKVPYERKFLSLEFVDVNGDGIQDPVWVERAQNGNQFVMYSIVNSEGQEVIQFREYAGRKPILLRKLDFNLDGRDDLVVYNPNASSNRWRVHLSEPTKVSGGVDWRLSKTARVLPFDAEGAELVFADYDGDGITDAYYLDSKASAIKVYRGLVVNSRKSHSQRYGFESDPIEVNLPFNAKFEKSAWGDFNGSGSADLVVSYEYRSGCGAASSHCPRRYRLSVFARSEGGFEERQILYSGNQPINALLAVDINGDGVSDLAYRVARKDWQYRLSDGKQLAEATPIHDPAHGSYSLKDDAAGFADMHGNGHVNYYWREDSAYRSKAWLPTEQRFSAVRSFQPGSGMRNRSLMFADFDATGSPNRVLVPFPEAGGVTLQVIGGGSSEGVIQTITNGLGVETQIEYKTLADTHVSDHYRSYGGISPYMETREHCWGGHPIPASPGYVERRCETRTTTHFDVSDFYTLVNDPFSDLPPDAQHIQPDQIAPVQELRGAIPVVSEVSSSAPTEQDPDGMARVKYQYELGFFQASGRGMLGFKSLRTIDQQTGIVTETTYRQDWPFIGQPIATTRLTAEGSKLSESLSGSRIYGYSSSMAEVMKSEGSAALGPLQVYNDWSIDLTFELKDDGATQGALLTQTTTKQEVDEYGNVTLIAANTKDHDGHEAGKTTFNVYGSTSWEQEKGRLSHTNVEHKYGSQTLSKAIRFEYHKAGRHKGLLSKEFVNEGRRDSETYETRHFYDSFGNKIFTSKRGRDGSARVGSLTTYDQRGRYPIKTFKLYNKGVGPNADNIPAQYIDELISAGIFDDTSVQLSREVINRDPLGSPIETRNYIGTNGSIVEISAVSGFGAKYFETTTTGSYLLSTAAKGRGHQCPSHTAYHSRERAAGDAEEITCFDGIGRKVRSAILSFDGRWSYTDTRYDKLGRVAAVSEPAFGAPAFWTTYEYNLLGEPTQTVGPDGSRLFHSYDGLTTVTTNDKGQEKRERRNGVGDLSYVVDDNDFKIEYDYSADGAVRMIKTPLSASVIGYDTLGRKSVILDPDKGAWSYTYNAIGELVCQRDAVGNTISNRYDAAGRLVERVDRRATAGNHCNNLIGKVTGHAYWEYDTAPSGLGQLSDTYDGVSGYQKVYNYDGYGRSLITVTHIAAPRGREAVYELVLYDQFGRPWKIYDAARNGANLNHNILENYYNEFGYAYRVVDETGYEYYRATGMDARGNVTSMSLGGGAVETRTGFNPRTGRVEDITSANAAGIRLQEMSMDWDSVGNLKWRTDNGANTNNTYRSLREDFDYDNLNRLTEYSVDGDAAHVTRVRYDRFGRITSKSDVGSYEYDRFVFGQQSFAVTKAGVHRYDHNDNGSVLNDSRGRSFAYTPFDMVQKVSKGGRHTEFHYTPDRKRYKRVDIAPDGRRTTTLYLGNVEKVYHSDDTQEWRQYIGGVSLVTRAFDNAGALTDTKKQFLLKDHLGSINAIVDAHGLLQTQMAFDPWGKRRNVSDWRAMSSSVLQNNWFVSTKPATSRGFTGHEMVDEMEIIHMNGRIYDPSIARFLQADPFVQSPTTTMSLNRYAYVWDNPLNAVDPSGYFLKKLWDDVRPYVGAVVGVALIAMTGGTTASIFLSNWYMAAAAGAISGAAGAAANGGNILRGALTGAVSGAAFYGIGTYVGANYSGDFAAGLSGTGFATKVAMHSMAGGVMSVLQGGKFGHGFAAAGATAGFSSVNNSQHIGRAGFSTGRVMLAAAVGGTVSRATGGKFANGAMTGAFSQAFNNEVGEARAQKDVEKYFKHSTEHSPTKFTSSEMPGEVRDALAGILDSPLGDGIRSGFENTGERIDIVLSLSVENAWEVMGNEIYYHPNLAEFSSRNVQHTLGSLMAHEIGHTTNYLSTISDYPRLGTRANENWTVRNVEDVYRAHKGIELRRDYEN